MTPIEILQVALYKRIDHAYNIGIQQDLHHFDLGYGKILDEIEAIKTTISILTEEER
jgi:hypothetical protein